LGEPGDLGWVVMAHGEVYAREFGWDTTFGLIKVNPLATWTDDDVACYLGDHELPQHPLVARGYRSIGCAPTTRPVGEGEDARAGRWAGLDKTECGLHV